MCDESSADEEVEPSRRDRVREFDLRSTLGDRRDVGVGDLVSSGWDRCVRHHLAAAVDDQTASAAVTYMGRMPRVYGALLARDMYRKLGPALSGSKEWVKWFTANQELFAVG